VADGLKKSASKDYELRLLPRLPTLSLSGLPSQTGSVQQPAFRVRLASTYPVQISGEVALNFTPNAVNQSDDPGISFVTGGRRVSFTIPAGNTESAEIRFQTGSVAGAISFSVPTIRAQARGGDISFAAIASLGSTTVPRAAPVIRSACFAAKSSSAISIQVVGYSNTRDLTQAAFDFAAEPNYVVQPPSHTQPLSTPAGTWFRGSGAAYGGQFTYTQNFSASTGDLTKLTSVSITLSNGAGSSSSATAAGMCP